MTVQELNTLHTLCELDLKPTPYNTSNVSTSTFLDIS